MKHEPKAVDQYFVRTQKIIDEHGIMVQWVAAGEGSLAFAYTVGLAAHGKPELLIYGLPPDTAQSILNDMALPIEDANWKPGLSRQIFGDGVPALLVKIIDSMDAEMTITNRMYAVPGQGPVDALQIVFPDAAGLWPWEEGSKVANQPVKGNIELATVNAGEIICPCGNYSRSDGFHPCDSEGATVEPTEELWPEPLMACASCGRIISVDGLEENRHRNTAIVIGQNRAHGLLYQPWPKGTQS
jgi:hypothetical protein